MIALPGAIGAATSDAVGRKASGSQELAADLEWEGSCNIGNRPAFRQLSLTCSSVALLSVVF